MSGNLTWRCIIYIYTHIISIFPNLIMISHAFFCIPENAANDGDLIITGSRSGWSQVRVPYGHPDPGNHRSGGQDLVLVCKNRGHY